MKKASELEEKNSTSYYYKGEKLYLIGRGHCFGRGFYNEFLTKSAIKVVEFSTGNFYVENRKAKLNGKNEIVLIPEEPKEIKNIEKKISSEDIKMPIVRNVNSKLVSDDIISVKPKMNE